MKLDAETYERIIENLHDGLYFVDKNRLITYWNAAAEKITGYKAEEVVGKACSENILNHVDNGGNSLCTGMCPLADSLSDGNPRDGVVYLHHKDGHRMPVSVRVMALRDLHGNIIGGVEMFSDISNQAAQEARVKEIEKLAFLDSLTQLANRNYIERELHGRFEEKKRFDMPFGILLMDIDHFKKVNDFYGHDVGDNVLRFVANTFIANARPFDLYGRWGGEEFIGIIRNITRKDLMTMGDRIRRLIKNSFLMQGNKKLQVTISIGATMVEATDTIETLIKRADILLYECKAAGRDCIKDG
jgi:diguanylate cyclase (GGDEF)-like protein/PAS domain S-box-containing protein